MEWVALLLQVSSIIYHIIIFKLLPIIITNEHGLDALYLYTSTVIVAGALIMIIVIIGIIAGSLHIIRRKRAEGTNCAPCVHLDVQVSLHYN